MGLRLYQLIEELKKYDQELEVVVDGYEGGTEPVEIGYIGLRYVDRADDQPYCGKYGDTEDSPDGMEDPSLVIIIGRCQYG